MALQKAFHPDIPVTKDTIEQDKLDREITLAEMKTARLN